MTPEPGFYLIPEVTVGMLVLVGAYAYAVSPLNPDRPARPPGWRIAAFFVGALSVFIALHPPIERFADELFSVHMVQHTLIALVAAPSLIVGLPEWLVEPVFKVRSLRVAARWLTRLPVALVVGSGVFWIWHMPPLYELALRERAVHDFEHLSIAAGSVVMWWPVFSPSWSVPQARRPMQLLYLFLLMMPGALFSALLIFGSEPIYPSYVLAASTTGIDPMRDQRIGGLIMKLGSLVIFWAVLTVYFFTWMNRVPDRLPTPGEVRQ